jgi:pyruvate dehydrogenase (quinone)
MGATVADAVVERLRAWGVRRIFGYSGDGINGFLGALQRAGDIEFVQARHEESAALMACAHAKYTGELGVVTSTQGPGAVHLLNGLYDAKLDRKPVLAIIGQQHRSVLGSAYQQEIDLPVLFADVAAQYSATIDDPEQVPLVVDRAVRVAHATSSPTCLVFPHDVQKAEAAALPDRAHGTIHTAVGVEPARVVPSDDALRRAADVLSSGTRVAILAGQGTRNAGRQLIEVADRLGAGVAKALLGKPAIPDDLPFVTGAVGHLGTTASQALMDGCDTLLLVGTNEPYTEFLPRPGQARAVQIDIDARNLGSRYPTEVNLVGDAALTLEALLPLLEPSGDGAWRELVEAEVAGWWTDAERRATAELDGALNPQRLLWELSSRLPDDALLAVDVGSVTYWYARLIRLRAGMDAHLSSTLASMGSAMPYAIAAKLAYPGRLVVALAGDGAMQMNGINELITIAARWRDWADPRLPILVLQNRDLSEVSWEMREMEGAPRWAPSQDLPAVDYAAYARLLGLGGITVTAPDEVAAAWDEALSADRPVLIDAIVERDAPLLPPTMPDTTAEQLHASLDAEGRAGARARRAVADQRLSPTNLRPAERASS